MKKTILISLAFILISCGPSQQERQEIAQLTCNIMGESRNMDGALRIKEINAAREKLGEPPFLGSDDVIKESFEYGLCTDLVLSNNEYRDLLISTKQDLKDARSAERKRRKDAEDRARQLEARISAEHKEATEARLRAEAKLASCIEANRRSLDPPTEDALLNNYISEINKRLINERIRRTLTKVDKTIRIELMRPDDYSATRRTIRDVDSFFKVTNTSNSTVTSMIVEMTEDQLKQRVRDFPIEDTKRATKVCSPQGIY